MSDKPKIPKRLQRDRDKDGNRAKEEFEKADYKGVSNEQIIAEGYTVDKLGIPTTWEQGDGPISVRGKDALIVTPDDQQVASFAVTPRRTICGECKFFDLEKGRKKIIEEDFGRKLAKELEWNPDHLGADLDTFGLCGQSGGSMLCSTMTLACDQFRAKIKMGKG